MTQLSLDPRFDFTIYALQLCPNFLPTYELHISLSGRKRKRHHLYCLGEDPQIPHILRDLRVSYNEALSFILKKNSRIIVEQRTWDIVLDLIILSFNFSRPKWRLRTPWLKVICVSLRSDRFILIQRRILVWTHVYFRGVKASTQLLIHLLSLGLLRE